MAGSYCLPGSIGIGWYSIVAIVARIALFTSFGGLDNVIHLPGCDVMQTVSAPVVVCALKLRIQIVQIATRPKECLNIPVLRPVGIYLHENPIRAAHNVDMLFNPQVNPIRRRRVICRDIPVLYSRQDEQLSPFPIQTQRPEGFLLTSTSIPVLYDLGL